MGERVLSWVKCNKCQHLLPVEAREEDIKTKENLYHIPVFCPQCGSKKLDFSKLDTEYYG